LHLIFFGHRVRMKSKYLTVIVWRVGKIWKLLTSAQINRWNSSRSHTRCRTCSWKMIVGMVLPTSSSPIQQPG